MSNTLYTNFKTRLQVNGRTSFKSAANWWLRNPNTGNTNNENNVNTSGQPNNNNANNTNGFSPDIIEYSVSIGKKQYSHNGEVQSMAIAKHADVMQATYRSPIGLRAVNTDIESI